MMLIPILILVLTVLFVCGFFNVNYVIKSTKKFMLHVLKPFSSSHVAPLEPNSSAETKPKTNNKMTKKEDDLRRVFDTFDKNGDGFITREELKESLTNMGMMVLGKDIEEMVEKLDSNKDGLVDVGEFKELYEMVKGKKEEKNEVSDDIDDDDDEDLKEAFNVFDDNKDGKITVDELGLVLSSLGLKEGKREEDCVEMIKKVDVDGDGMVNFDEFKMMMKANSSKSSKLVHVF